MTSRLASQHDLIARLVREGESRVSIAARLGVPASTLKDYVSRYVGNGYSWQKGDTDVFVQEDGTAIASGTANTPEELMARLGLDPEEWNIERARVNQWGDTTQLRLDLTPKKAPEVIFPAPGSLIEYERPAIALDGPSTGESELYVIVGDQQAPYHDKVLHELFCQFLADVSPSHGISLGDGMDLPSLSRFKRNPRYDATVQQCVDTFTTILYDYVRASEGTQWQLLDGNHDERLRDYLLQQADDLYGIRPGAVPGEAEAVSALSIRNLLNLDQFGIEYVGSDGDGNYSHASVSVGDKLTVRHGRFTGPTASRKTYERLGAATIFGHTHSKDTLWVTTKGSTEVHRVDQAGCMCEIQDGLGYDEENPNWQQGFVTVELWPDGYYNIDHATYVNGKLLWRGERWDA